jgi:hypothetical protein
MQIFTGHVIVVGRGEQQQQIRQHAKIGERVLVHGTAGVGKDHLIASCLRQEEFKKFKYAISVVGSTEVDLQNQLVRFFETHVRVLQAGDADGKEKLKKVRAWLEAHPQEWLLVVEDVTSASFPVLVECIPPSAGCVVMSSQETLQKPNSPLLVTFPLHLQPLTTEQCVEIWVATKALTASGAFRTEEEVKAYCAGKCDYKGPSHEQETPEQKKSRHQSLLISCILADNPELPRFLNDVIGHLPLTVQVLGQLLRADTAGDKVRRLMDRFEAKGLSGLESDSKARTDHFYGLTRSVLFSLENLVSAPQHCREAFVVLVAMSMLHPTLTPATLFQSSDLGRLLGGRFEQGLALLEQRGLARGNEKPGGGPVVHQLVQRCIREQLVGSTGRAGIEAGLELAGLTAKVVDATRSALVELFAPTQQDPSRNRDQH